ncbi:hypothetical protein G7Y89_g14403 [Cudoniella acicularis]|uniref:AB hydrolase-1 domain-containing protein n=1 Tax=Cudoniella acicularis TaxID=354080 RepID=A0A8H4VTI3_9HELO|nr:hypothetical protein G7Y89_g14403 [Cudoniella acicularis]
MASSAPSLPTIILVPGACHSAACFNAILQHLHTAGFPTQALTLPSLNSSSPNTATCAEDSAFILETAILPLLNEGKDVLLIGHSYSSVPISGSALGLSKSRRIREGKEGGVVGLVFMTAFLVPGGEATVFAFGGNDPPQQRNDTVCSASTNTHFYISPLIPLHSPPIRAKQKRSSNQPSPGLAVFENPAELFYPDLPPSSQKQYTDLLQPHAYNAFHTQCLPPAWAEDDFKGRRAYIKCMADIAVPPVAQQAMLDSTGVEWIVREIEAAHSPFASKPEELARLIVGLRDEFEGVA